MRTGVRCGLSLINQAQATANKLFVGHVLQVRVPFSYSKVIAIQKRPGSPSRDRGHLTILTVFWNATPRCFLDWSYRFLAQFETR